MTREQAWNLVQTHVKNKNLQKHMLATEAVMRHMAEKFHEDIELWGLAGLLHDLDYDQTVEDFDNHGIITAEILKDRGIPETVIHAIKSHPGHLPRESLLDKVLYAVDPVTGLIVAAALMHPSKKLKDVDQNFLMRRFGEKRFAAGADRDQIRSCESFDMPLEVFLEESLKAMQKIDDILGL